MDRLLTDEEVEGRLNCFGDFDAEDEICLTRCALNISCAIAKNKYFSFQHGEDTISSVIFFENE